MAPPPLPPDPYAAYPGAPGPPNNAGLKAAVAVWVTFGIFLLFSTCCVGGIAAIGFLPLDQLKQADESGAMTQEMWDEFGNVQQYMPVAAAVIALFTLVPSVVMLVLGFSVKNGSRGATITAMVISILGLVGVGLMFLGSLFNMVTTGQFDICGLSLFLGLAACFVWCILSLKAALSANPPNAGYPSGAFTPMHQHGTPSQPTRSPDDDPWENSL